MAPYSDGVPRIAQTLLGQAVLGPWIFFDNVGKCHRRHHTLVSGITFQTRCYQRQPEFSDAAIQVCLTMKVLFGMLLRQTTGFVESLLVLAGLNWKVPDFSTLCRRQKTLNVSIPYRGGSGPLHLLIDATGIKPEGEGEWNARKHRGSKKRLWRKRHTWYG